MKDRKRERGSRPSVPDRERGDALAGVTSEGTRARRWFGAPAIFEMKRRFDGVLPSTSFATLIAQIRELMHDPGIVEQTDSSFTWSSRPGRHALQAELMVVVRVDGPATSLVATDRLDALIVRSFGRVGGAVGAGGLVAPIAASIVLPHMTPLFVIGWLGGVYGGIRAIYRRLAQGRARTLKRVFDLLVHEIEPAIT